MKPGGGGGNGLLRGREDGGVEDGPSKGFRLPLLKGKKEDAVEDGVCCGSMAEDGVCCR
jgi:hypothetical protein